jgi:luciferase family oxidoreductase group 1
MRALRRDAMASDAFPRDVQELQGYLAGRSLVPGVDAVPGRGTQVPLYILGSSLFGAQLAAALGLPYAFASHFAPQALTEAVAIYRRDFQPSEQLAEPWVIAGVNVVAADTTDAAFAMLRRTQRIRVRQLLARGRDLTDAEADAVLDSPSGRQIEQMSHYTAAGTPDEVHAYLDEFAVHAQADELIVASLAPTTEGTLDTFERLAHVADLTG